FQAEDGIRDLIVTGVQTCALPILFFLVGMAFAYFFVFPIAFGFFAGYAPVGVQMMTDIDKYLSFVLTMFIAFGLTFETPVVVIRSEERRVGKECRSGSAAGRANSR